MEACAANDGLHRSLGILIVVVVALDANYSCVLASSRIPVLVPSSGGLAPTSSRSRANDIIVMGVLMKAFWVVLLGRCSSLAVFVRFESLACSRAAFPAGLSC